MSREKEEERVRRALASMGAGVENVTKRTIEATVCGLLGVKKLRLSKGELMDLAREVFDDRQALAEKEYVENKAERVAEVKKLDSVEKKKAKPKKKKKKEEEEEEGVQEPPAKKSKKTGDSKKQQRLAAEVEATRQRAAAAQAAGGWTLARMLEQAGWAPRPQLFCRRCGTLLPAANTAQKHCACLQCAHRTPVGHVAGREAVSRWAPRVVSKIKVGEPLVSAVLSRLSHLFL